MKPHPAFKASANYLQLALTWRPAEALCLDLEILKFIGFSLTLFLEDKDLSPIHPAALSLPWVWFSVFATCPCESQRSMLCYHNTQASDEL